MYKGAVGLFGLALVVFSVNASATPILCSSNTALNHMKVDSSQVSACLASGVGNLTANPANDLFLTGSGSAYAPAGKSDGANPFGLTFTQSGSTGTWSFDSAFWSSHSAGAIGFKFGTGNNPDEWFVYSLVSGVSSGTWEFVNRFNNPAGKPIGGGLSHDNLYGVKGSTQVPEPGSLALLGAGLVALSLTRRRLGSRPIC